MARVNWFLKIQVKFIKNQKFLKNLIIDHDSLEAGVSGSIQEAMIERELILYSAINNLHNAEYLADIAMNVKCLIDLGRHTNYTTKVLFHVEYLAVLKIQNPILLEDIAKKTTGEVQKLALQRLDIMQGNGKIHGIMPTHN